MATQIMHIGTRSWWNGSVKTLCGLKIREPGRVWFPSLSGNRVCPACKAIQQGGR
ncbi:hypothetical protein Lesp02_85250 [Lentzea sp. NBRC 105346]|uniref:hypothetical protein n=1 Tax=Lentzea sp. NBRC 105346 TaxID=3032205 RepID=UPI0024A15107|nr:hypothetical protein [Lentzea sp. NBRC 105346]GLZ36338.1 hypothetical protein Lesp02_85250 [Lentzea sp. NBRC 105346]